MQHTIYRLFVFVFITVVGLTPGVLQAQSSLEVSGQAGIGEGPFSVSLAEIEKLDKEGLPTLPVLPRKIRSTRNPNKLPNPNALSGNQFPAEGNIDPMPLNTTQAIHSNFQAIELNESGAIPPDCMGAVSHTQICVLGNGRIKFYTKPTVCAAPLNTSTTTNQGSLANPVFSSSLRAFFTGVLGGFDVTDPHVYFDRLSERWFVVAISKASASNRIVIAVSSGNQITAQTSFNFYFITHDNGAPANSPDRGGFFDYPMPGLDRHALYIGGLIFDTNDEYAGSTVFVVNKASLLSGGNPQFTAFRQIGTNRTGIFAPQGVFNDDPEATRGFFVGANWEFFGRINFITINNPGSQNPTAVNSTVNVPSNHFGYPQPALGSNSPLDALGDERLLDAQMMKNKISGANILSTAHHIPVTTAGVSVSAEGVAGARNAMRWYQFTENSGNFTLLQSGTVFDNTVNNPIGYWMGSIAATGQGHAVLSSSLAGATRHANVMVSGRYSGQPLGILNPPVLATNFTETYNRGVSGGVQRWGDYSQTVVDPSDDMTVWTFQQFTNATNSWAVRAVQLKAPPPAIPVSVENVSCDGSRKAVMVINGRADNFAGFFDPGEPRGAPATQRRLAVTSTGNVVVSQLQSVTPTQIRLEANLANAVLGSRQTLTITNPDCQQVTIEYTLPTSCSGGSVNPPPSNFQIKANPPQGGIMEVTLPEATGELRLIASDGKRVGVWQVTNTLMRIPVGNFSAGVYFLEYSAAAKERVIRVFIQ